MRKNSFVEGTIIATLAIVFTKILGMLYVIPFYSIIGSQGSSLYSYAYNIYMIFLSISSAGIPTAMSKIVSEYESQGLKEAKVRSFKIGIFIVSILSVLCFLVLMFFSESIAKLIVGDMTGGNSLEDITLVIFVVSFAVLFIPFLSVARGYLQGHKYIQPSSTSQMIEQIVRIVVIIVGSFFIINILHKSVSLGVAVAVAGAFVGGLAAILYIARKIFTHKKELSLDEKLIKDKVSNKEILKKICSYAIPFVIINVRSVLENMDPNIEQAANDLGANKLKTFFYVVLPSLVPGIMSGAQLAFTLSLDDVVISYFTAGPGSNTLPLKIYSMIKTGSTPDVNALSTIILIVTLSILMFVTLKQVKRLRKEVQV